MKYELKDYLNAINQTKKNILAEDQEAVKGYPPFIINKCLSSFTDAVLYANEMNQNAHLDKKLQFDFFINTLKPRKRFSPWVKKQTLEHLELAAFVVPREVSFWGSADDNGARYGHRVGCDRSDGSGKYGSNDRRRDRPPGEYGVALEVTKNVEEDSLSAIDLYGLLEERMLHVISLAMTYDFLALFASLSNSVGVSGADFTIAQAIAAQRNLRVRGTDADAVIYILENQQAADIEDELTSTNAAAAVFALSADRLINYAPTADNGMGASRQVMTFRGAPVFTSGQCATANAAADVVGACFCPSTAYHTPTPLAAVD